MAREVKMPYDFVTSEPINLEKLKAFEALVRADERKQIALDKMAENARQVGLDYEPAQRTWVGLGAEWANEELNVQEPVMEPKGKCKECLTYNGHQDGCYATTPAAQPAPVQRTEQEPVAWMTINAYGEEDDIHYENPEGHLPDGWTYLPLYTTPPKAERFQEEPLGYWNAVEGWVELQEEEHKPTAWVYPEALEAFRQGKPWTAYGKDGNGPNPDGIERIPLYTTPPAAQPAVPDAMRESPDYREGWNDCRALMLEMRKP